MESLLSLTLDVNCLQAPVDEKGAIICISQRNHDKPAQVKARQFQDDLLNIRSVRNLVPNDCSEPRLFLIKSTFK